MQKGLHTDSNSMCENPFVLIDTLFNGTIIVHLYFTAFQKITIVPYAPLKYSIPYLHR